MGLDKVWMVGMGQIKLYGMVETRLDGMDWIGWMDGIRWDELGMYGIDWLGWEESGQDSMEWDGINEMDRNWMGWNKLEKNEKGWGLYTVDILIYLFIRSIHCWLLDLCNMYHMTYITVVNKGKEGK